MTSLAQVHLDVPSSPTTASESVAEILHSLGYLLDDHHLSGAADLPFTSKRQILRCKLAGKARITGQAFGSRIDLKLDIAPNEPGGLLDKRRNQKSLDELAAQISATLGTV